MESYSRSYNSCRRHGWVGLQQGGSMTAVGFWLTCVHLPASVSNVIMTCNKATALFHGIFSGMGRCSVILPLGILSLYFEGLAAWKAAWDSLNWVTLANLLGIFCNIRVCNMGRLLSRYPAVQLSFALLVPVIV